MPAAKKKATPKKKTAAKKKMAAKKKSSFTIRSIKAAVDELRASQPGVKLNSPKKQDHHDSVKCWSFDRVGTWPSSPPQSVLYQQNNPFRYSKKVLTDPKMLVSYANFSAVGTWNAKGTAAWQNSPDAWIIADVSLVQEQAEGFDDYFFDDEGGGSGGSYVDLIFALWKVEEGWAAAIWRPSDRDLLARLIGLPSWPKKGWKNVEVWYGED